MLFYTDISVSSYLTLVVTGVGLFHIAINEKHFVQSNDQNSDQVMSCWTESAWCVPY